jgi:hypothetical protein
VENSRPFQKLHVQCVIGARRMTPTIHQSSARAARLRLLELSRQVAVDFQPDADFDESRRCPGHRFVPFMGQYHSPSLAYRGDLWIQEIKTIAFVYGPGSRFPVSARLTGIVLPPRHSHDDAAAWLAEILARVHPRSRANPSWKTSQKDRRIVGGARRGRCRSIRSIDCENAGIPLRVPPFAKAVPFLLSLPKTLPRPGRSDAILTRTYLPLDRRFSHRPDLPSLPKGRSCK